jgi:hypothetical protein
MAATQESWKVTPNSAPRVDTPLLIAAYDAGPPPMAYVEPIAVGEVLPAMSSFLKPEFLVPAPLEATY